MPVSHATLSLLMDAGLIGDELLRVVASIEADNQPKERSANAIRQARHRDKKREAGVTDNVTNNVPSNVTAVTEPRARVEDNLPTKKLTGQTRKKQTREQDLADFVSVLSPLLDEERVQALVDVRDKKGGKLNGHAASLLKAKIEACGLSPAEAADTMALRNWISIERDWVQRQQSPPRQERKGVVGAAEKILESRANGSTGIFGSHGDAQRISTERGGEPGGSVTDIRGGVGRQFVASRN